MQGIANVGPFRSRLVYQPHEGRTYVEKTQPNERAILEDNAERRKQEQHGKFYLHALKIPQIGLQALAREDPELVQMLMQGDPQQRKAAVLRISILRPEWTVAPKNKIIATR